MNENVQKLIDALAAATNELDEFESIVTDKQVTPGDCAVYAQLIDNAVVHLRAANRILKQAPPRGGKAPA